MPTSTEILQELEAHGSPSIAKTLIKHGAIEGKIYGVKAEYLKIIQKRIKKDYALSMQLFDSGISDAMYLAGLIADESKMSKAEINDWAEKAYWYYLSEYAVSWVAAESPYGEELGLEWIDSDKENVVTSGWATLRDWVSFRPDSELDIKLYTSLLERVERDINTAPNRVKYIMNGFLISVGAYIGELTALALAIGTRIGKVKVDMGQTACKVPYSPEYIQKVLNSNGGVPKKKKKVKC